MAQVSIGVPVYNGADLLFDCLECLRTQTFQDLEVIVSDNASTDGSLAIAQDFAARDSRFRVISHPQSIGMVGNFLAVLDAARAPFFSWRADDDLSSANYVEVLHGLLTGNPDAVLAVGRVESSLLGGAVLRRRPFPQPQWGVPYNIKLMFRSHPSWGYGLWRTDYLRVGMPRAADAYPHLWAQDHLLLFPVLVRRAVAGSNDAVFRQRYRTMVKEGAQAYVFSPQLRVQQMRDFYRACVVELDRAERLSPGEQILTRMALPFYVNKRVHRWSKVVKGYVAAAFGRS